jgi:periplasmic protein TonB
MHTDSQHRIAFQLDDESPTRSLGIATALALHLGAALLLFGAGGSAFRLPEFAQTEIEVEWIRPEKPIEAPPAPPMPVAPAHARPRPLAKPLPAPPTPQPVVVDTAEFAMASVPTPAEAAPSMASENAALSPDQAGGGPIEAGQLAYAGRPPAVRYPSASLRAGEQGTVLLRILVDVRGQPLRVEVARSSGHRSLDRAVVEYARRELRFVPAKVGGRPVQAYAQVPVDFRLPGAG